MYKHVFFLEYTQPALGEAPDLRLGAFLRSPEWPGHAIITFAHETGIDPFECTPMDDFLRAVQALSLRYANPASPLLVVEAESPLKAEDIEYYVRSLSPEALRVFGERARVRI